MKLEILRTYVILEANNHNVKPTNMTIGGFSISLDDVDIEYDNFEFEGGWDDGYAGPDDNCESTPTIEWTCRGGSDVYRVNNELIKDSEEYQFDNFKHLPGISSIREIFYEAFSNTSEGVEYEFYPTYFSIVVVDRDTDEEYEIVASNEVLQAYIEKMIDERELSKTI